jgi:hypothetical protein
VSKSGTHDQKVWGGGSLTDFAGLDQALDVGVVLERALPVPESEKKGGTKLKLDPRRLGLDPLGQL